MKKFSVMSLGLVMVAMLATNFDSLAQLGSASSQLNIAPFTQLNTKPPPPMKLVESLPANLFVELAKIINPTVVNISTSAVPRGRSGMRDPMMELLEQFYGVRPKQQSNRPRQMGLGTGFIIRDDGLILTNAHVIAGADIINVQLTENSEKTYEAKLIGSDERTDIALIKIDATHKFPAASLGDSSKVEVGEWVAAFGNPFGHGHTMTKGIISSKGREIGEINKIPLFQTDASINPGNSGGPLVDSRGYVIGVNSAIDARAQGIGFAIPIDEVRKILPDLEQRGAIRKGFIGVALGDIDSEAAADLGLGEVEGAVITGLERNAPASKAGLKPYDIVTEFAGRKVKNSRDLSDAVSDAKIGEAATVKLIRDRKSMSLSVVVAERPSSKKAGTPLANKEKPTGVEIKDFGMTISNLTASQKEDWGLAADMNRPVITETQRDGKASKYGLRVGDVIMEVNRKPVTSATEAAKLIQSKQNTFRIIRQNRMIVVTISE
ncbi:MAG: trypsin-like peptidase domain-containing protein [Pseudobdellovibrionaceae bacterium]